MALENGQLKPPSTNRVSSTVSNDLIAHLVWIGRKTGRGRFGETAQYVLYQGCEFIYDKAGIERPSEKELQELFKEIKNAQESK